MENERSGSSPAPEGTLRTDVATTSDAMAELDAVDRRPLAEHVTIFEAVHEQLTARLASAED